MTREWKAAGLSAGASAAVVVMAATGVMLDNPGEIALADAARSLAALTLLAVAIPILAAATGVLRRFGYAFPIILFATFKFVGFQSTAEFFGLFDLAAVGAGLGGLALVSAAAIEPFRRRDPAKVAAFVFVVAASAAAASAGAVAFEQAQQKPAARDAVAAISGSLPSPIGRGVGGEGVGGEGADDTGCVRRLPSNWSVCKASEGAAVPEPSPLSPLPMGEGDAVPASGLRSRDLPDIIYIVPDRYGAAGVLKAEYGHDNSAFIAALESRGFFVAKNARSNYPKTFQSLASSMNMRNLDPLFAAMGPAAKDKTPLYALIRENAVQRELRALGYRYIHLGNWWEPTRKNPHADENFYGLDNLWSKLNEFEHALLRTTPVAFIATYGGFVDRNECARLKAQLDRLERARAASEKPMFVFAHLTMPHDPVTMDEAGRCIPHVYYPGPGATWDTYRAAYAGYVRYLNARLIEIFDANRAFDNGRDMIFVIQADEGPYPKRLHLDGEMNLHDFTNDEIRIKFGIINAIYWDADQYGRPYATATPINNWRIILSKISGLDMPLIEDERSILYRSDEFAYDGKDVTAVFRRATIAAN